MLNKKHIIKLFNTGKWTKHIIKLFNTGKWTVERADKLTKQGKMLVISLGGTVLDIVEDDY